MQELAEARGIAPPDQVDMAVLDSELGRIRVIQQDLSSRAEELLNAKVISHGEKLGVKFGTQSLPYPEIEDLVERLEAEVQVLEVSGDCCI